MQNDFLENMTFKNGEFVAAKIGGLMEVVGSERIKGIIGALAAKTESSKTLCGNGVCYDAGCFSHGCEESTTHSVCTSSCNN